MASERVNTEHSQTSVSPHCLYRRSLKRELLPSAFRIRVERQPVSVTRIYFTSKVIATPMLINSIGHKPSPGRGASSVSVLRRRVAQYPKSTLVIPEATKLQRLRKDLDCTTKSPLNTLKVLSSVLKDTGRLSGWD